MSIENSLLDFFEDLEDPRLDRCKRHLLIDIIAISVCAVISGCDAWDEIEDYGKAKYDWLKTFLSLPNGIPSHDTFNRVFSILCPESFERCFGEWVASLSCLIDGEVVAIDGKTIRGAKVNGTSPIHMVSAWACERNLVLGQSKVEEKSNEITAIPNLIEALDLVGTTVTIDAMGCQTKIAQKIIDAQANYVLGVKGNQPELLQNIEDEFRFNKKIDTFNDVDYGHGRIETRVCSVISDFIHMENLHKWPGITSVVRIVSTREFKATGKIEHANRYYITSLNDGAEKLQQVIRNHWAIENKLHWSLDVSFNEDQNRKRKGNASQNFSLINKIALNLAKQEKTCKMGIKSKRKKAAYDNSYLEILLKI